MDPNMPLAVLRARPKDLSTHALVVGDPQRAEAIAGLLEKSQELGRYREYVTFAGYFRDKRIVVSSHGVGAAGACICFEELFQGGVRTVIRVGTCAALADEIEDGQLIVPTGAIRQDGMTAELIPLNYPAIADRHVIAALNASAAAQAVKTYTGLVLTEATLYPGLVRLPYELWISAGALCVEMEMAALLVVAGIHRVQAGGILASDRNLGRILKARLPLDPSAYNPHRDVVAQGTQTMIEVALEAIVALP